MSQRSVSRCVTQLLRSNPCLSLHRDASNEQCNRHWRHSCIHTCKTLLDVQSLSLTNHIPMRLTCADSHCNLCLEAYLCDTHPSDKLCRTVTFRISENYETFNDRRLDGFTKSGWCLCRSTALPNKALVKPEPPLPPGTPRERGSQSSHRSYLVCRPS